MVAPRVRGRGRCSTQGGELVTDDTALISWVDPGLVSGLAHYDLGTRVFGSSQHDKSGLLARLEELNATAGDRMMFLGWEAYLKAGGPQAGTSEYSEEVIGALKDFARTQYVRTLTPQPSSARKLGSKVFLRRLGWYTPGQVHANDASMHLLADLMRMKPRMPVEIHETLFPGYRPGVTIPT